MNLLANFHRPEPESVELRAHWGKLRRFIFISVWKAFVFDSLPETDGFVVAAPRKLSAVTARKVD